MRELPPVELRALVAGGAVAAVASLLLSMVPADGPFGGAAVAGVAAGAAVAGRLARAHGAFHGGLVAVLLIAAEALAEPLRPAATDVAADLARTVIADALRLGAGVLFGWLGHRARAGRRRGA